MFRRRFEISTFGVDEANQGLTTDPIVGGNNPSSSLGLRVPPVFAATQDKQPRYLFLLASRQLNGKTIVRGIRQGLTIGTNVSTITNISVVEEFLVTTPYWHFVDGNVSWHLVREPSASNISLSRPTDAASWAFTQSDDPAMLYQSFTNTNVDPRTGAPFYYPVGLTGYVPPSPNNWQPVAGLGNLKDMRFPWNAPTEAQGIGEEVEGSCRISLYASILQTNPATRALGSYPAPSAMYPGGMVPETAFVQSYAVSGEGGARSPTQYCHVFGSILFEDYGDGE